MKSYFIQIGTAYGNDFFYHNFVTKYKEKVKLILIEPSDYFDQAKNFYDNLNIEYQIFKSAVVTNEVIDDEVEIHYYHDAPSELTSVINRNDLNFTRKEKVKSLKINDVLKKVPNDCEIDLLFLDVEGYDREILLSADFSLREINNIVYEAAPEQCLDRNGKIQSKSIENLVYKKLETNGFYRLNHGSNEHWAKKAKEIYPINNNYT